MLSSESHDNADSDGEDADGFAAKLTAGPGNVFRYAVSHNNIDDGWDLYTKTDTGPIGVVTIEDSLAYNNGTLSNGGQARNGDRNGFKLGGEDIGVNHVIRRNIAYHNGKHGFTYNSNPGSMTISNNISIDNAERNFSFDEGTSTFRNNTSCRFSGDGIERQDRRQRRQLQPVLDRHQRLPLRRAQRLPRLVLRLRRPPRRHPRRPGRHPVTVSSPGPARFFRAGPLSGEYRPDLRIDAGQRVAQGASVAAPPRSAVTRGSWCRAASACPTRAAARGRPRRAVAEQAAHQSARP